MDKRKTGGAYELRAREHLEKKGYRIIEMNYYTRFGEIDIIAMDDQIYVFVEVKYRQSELKGRPFEAVGSRKRQRMMKTAVSYCKKHGLFNHCLRFDIIDILRDELTHYENAFEMDRRYCQF